MRWQSVAISLLSLVTFGSLGANKVLFDSALESYTEGLSVRLNPINDSRYADAELSRSPVMLFGDSRIEMWPELRVAGQAVENRGISGETTPQLLGRLETELNRVKPKVVVIQAGINDLKAIGVVPQLAKEIEIGTFKRLTEIAAICRSQGAHPIIFTVFPCGSVPVQRRFVWREEIEKARLKVNSSLLGLSPEEATVIDADKLLLGTPGQIKPDFAKDFLHLNAKGYGALGPETIKAIEDTLARF